MNDVDLDAPYVPAGARPFEIGDRVRIRLSNECSFATRDENSPKAKTKAPHCPGCDGILGTVSNNGYLNIPEAALGAHTYFVVFKRGLKVTGWRRPIWGDVFAANELELIEEGEHNGD